MARENARARLKGVFEDFIGQAEPEKVFFLREVLEDVNNDSSLSLPAAFAFETSMDHTYLKVPSSRVELVQKFLALLENEGEKEHAA